MCDTESDTEYDIKYHTKFSTESSTRSSTKSKEIDFESEMDNLEEDCEYLKKYAHILVVDLPKNVQNTFKRIKKLAKCLQGTKLYKQFYKITQGVFGQIVTKIRGTVADYFCGCSIVSPTDGCNIGCRAECAGSLPIPEDMENCTCDTHVATYSSWQNLSLIYSPNKECDKIRIYHTSKNISLSKSEVKFLQDKGINQAILMRTQGTMITQSQNVNNVANLMTQNNNNQPTNNKIKPNTNGVLFLIVFLVMIMIIILYVVRKCHGCYSCHKWDPLPSIHCFFC
jgi:hypothetical protein